MGRRSKHKESDRYFDTWELLVNGANKSVEVRVISQKDECRFVAIYRPKSPDEPKIECFGTDINKLRKDMRTRMQDGFKIDWKDKLYIVLDSDFDDHSAEWYAKIELSCALYQIANDTSGDPISRRSISDPYSPGWPEIGPPDVKDGEGKSWSDRDMLALVDDTPENRAAIEQFMTGFKKLKDGLAKIFHPKVAQSTLAGIPKLLLVEPKSEGKQVSKKS